MRYKDSYCTKLIHEMKTGQYADCKRLPRETELAEKLGVSRTRLRDILAQLEQEGIITRRHGIGTLINHHVLQVKNRMDLEVEFSDIIRQNGRKPAVTNVHLKEDVADRFLADKLELPLGTPIVRITRVCTADGKPAIYCEDILDRRLMKHDYTIQDLEAPIFHFLDKICGVEAYMDLTRLHAVTASDELAEILEVPMGTPLLNMEEVDYDVDGNIIFYSRQYFVDSLFEQTVLRKKI